MTGQAIAEGLKQKFPEDIKEINEFRGQMAVIVRKDRIKEIMRHLHDAPDLSFRYLVDVCGVDYLGKKEPRFEVVYQLYSISLRQFIRVRAEVPDNDPSIGSVYSIWRGADWHERECYDMFGIWFEGHPDMRRILMPEDWEGHPLRKDYPLKSDLGEKDWKAFKDTLELSEKNKAYEMRQDG